jgi:hypothetical protein
VTTTCGNKVGESLPAGCSALQEVHDPVARINSSQLFQLLHIRAAVTPALTLSWCRTTPAARHEGGYPQRVRKSRDA